MLPHQMAHQVNFTNKGYFPIRLFAFIPSSPISAATAAAAKSLQLCPTLCDPIDSSPPGSPIPGIFQARVLEWVVIAFSVPIS